MTVEALWAQWCIPVILNSQFFCGEGPRSRCYGHTAALRFIVQYCDYYYYYYYYFRFYV